MFMLLYSLADICDWRRNRDSSLTFTKSKKLKQKKTSNDYKYNRSRFVYEWNSVFMKQPDPLFQSIKYDPTLQTMMP